MIIDVIDALQDQVPDAFEESTLTFPWEDWAPNERDLTQLSPPEGEALGFPTEIGPGAEDGSSGLIWDGEGDPPIEEAEEQTEEGLRKSGIEALACYRSYHYGKDNWGIYIREEGLFYVAFRVFPSVHFDPLRRLQMAFRLLHGHEYFHFLTDVAATGMELVRSQPLYLPYVRLNQDKNPPWNKTEEGMANAFVFRKAWPSGCRSHIDRFMRNQPDGYNDFGRWGSPSQFRDGLRQLAAGINDYLKVKISRVGAAPDSFTMPALAELLFDTRGTVVAVWDVPVYLIRSTRSSRFRGTIRFISAISSPLESSQFAKDLSNLPRAVKDRWVKTRQLLRTNVRHPGLGFEKLKNCDKVFSVRVDQGYRATLRLIHDNYWEALRIGTHDYVYKKTPC